MARASRPPRRRHRPQPVPHQLSGALRGPQPAYEIHQRLSSVDRDPRQPEQIVLGGGEPLIGGTGRQVAHFGREGSNLWAHRAIGVREVSHLAAKPILETLPRLDQLPPGLGGGAVGQGGMGDGVGTALHAGVLEGARRGPVHERELGPAGGSHPPAGLPHEPCHQIEDGREAVPLKHGDSELDAVAEPVVERDHDRPPGRRFLLPPAARLARRW